MTVHGSSPSDLDLMLYADGELEPERIAEVEAWLSADAAARDKLAALCIVSRVVREEALTAASGADDLTDRIMAVVGDGGLPRSSGALPPPKPPVDPPAPARARPAANDNGRRLLFVAAALVAAAAAALLWMRSPDTRSAEVVPSALPAPTSAPSGLHALEAEVEHGVEVSAIDFGSTTGAVLYVPNGTSPSETTTVVWLSGDADGEDE